ncbi:hypothetical protein LCGC14_1469740 [marine sediment metagenome]|uniref:Terminase large subunit gp17-like C-terminal domain-containing protein n=1 Tax=marine sediment metagenome TaxID=412755 RepID=A0A0F9JDA6_9ZZZZ
MIQSKIIDSTSLGWQYDNLKIVNKAGEMVKLNHNIAQLKVHNTKRLQLTRGLPVRLIVLKARQEGVSTGEAADMFEDVNRRPNRIATLISADTDSTAKVWKMIRRFQSEIPSDVRREPKYSSRKELEYAEPHYSSILCQTAGKEVLGRGGTNHKLHATELAFWANAAKQIAPLFQEVPKTADTSIVIESTAFGTTGEFHDRFQIATKFVKDQLNLHGEIRDYNGFLPVFLAWHIFPDYQMELPRRGYHFEAESDHEVFGDECELIAKYNCTTEQLYWRRYTISTDFANDLPRFMAEYPATAKEAFQGTGRMVFLPSALDEMDTHVSKPIKHIEFYMEGANVKYREVNKRENCWAVWKLPESNHSYIVFGDVAEGILCDLTNKRSDPDRSVAGVFDRNDFDMPMVYYGRPDTIEFGHQMLMAAKFFNYAWASPEMNSIGLAVLNIFKEDNYPFIYQREQKEETESTEPGQLIGWRTTTLTRKPMIADLDKTTQEGQLRIYDHRVMDEFRTFVHGKDGKPQADVGKFDDCVIMVSGCIQLHQRCEMGIEDLSWVNKEDKPKTHVSVMGQADDDDSDMDGEEEDNALLYADIEDYED